MAATFLIWIAFIGFKEMPFYHKDQEVSKQSPKPSLTMTLLRSTPKIWFGWRKITPRGWLNIRFQTALRLSFYI